MSKSSPEDDGFFTEVRIECKKSVVEKFVYKLSNLIDKYF